MGRRKTLKENFNTVCTTLTQIFDRSIENAYHTGTSNMSQRQFGSLVPKEILEKILYLYGKPSLVDLEKSLLKLHDPMEPTFPVEVMIFGMEDIRMFLLANSN